MRLLPVALSTLALGACTILSGADDLVVGANEPLASPADGGGTSSSSSSSGGSSGTPIDGGKDGANVPPPPPGDAGCTPTANGPRYPSTASSPDWTTPQYARNPDGMVAHSDSLSPLVVSGFGFTIPSTSTIMGIKVDIARSAVGVVHDSAIGFPRGVPKANPAAWTVDNTLSSFPNATYGSPTDLWGTTWTPADVNGNGLMLAIGVTNASDDGHVDAVGITVYTCP